MHAGTDFQGLLNTKELARAYVGICRDHISQRIRPHSLCMQEVSRPSRPYNVYLHITKRNYRENKTVRAQGPGPLFSMCGAHACTMVQSFADVLGAYVPDLTHDPKTLRTTSLPGWLPINPSQCSMFKCINSRSVCWKLVNSTRRGSDELLEVRLAAV